MNQEYNIHHIIAKASPLSGSDHPDNKVTMNINSHRHLHNFHGLDAPHEQINRILSISEKVWIPENIDAIDALLKSFRGDYYKEHTMRKKGHKFTKSGIPHNER